MMDLILVNWKPKEVPLLFSIQRVLILPIVLLLSTSFASAATVDGFVTKIYSANIFDVGKTQIAINNQTECERGITYGVMVLPADNDMPSTYYRLRPYGSLRFARHRTVSIPCDMKLIVIGTRVHIVGYKYTATLFAAKRVRLYVVARSTVVTGKTLLEEKQRLKSISDKSDMNMWIDGYRFLITPQTNISFSSPNTMHSENLVASNMWVKYLGTQTSDGRISANKLTTSVNHTYPSSGNYTKIMEPNYDRRIPGEIQFSYGKPIEILPSQSIQKSIAALGIRLIPQYQVLLPDTDKTKVYFRFYIVQSQDAVREKKILTINGMLPSNTSDWGASEYAYSKPKLYGMIDNTIAMPDGVVLIPAHVLFRLHNQAQLAALLSYSITSILQNQIYNASLITESKSRYDILHRFSEMLQINEQVLRIGIRQMYLAGYDIREAPYAWAVAQGKTVQNPIINSKHPDQKIPWYAAYAFNYISHYYQDVDYSKLKRGEREYQQFLQELYKADPSLPRPQAQLEPQASARPRAAAQPAPQSSPAAPTASAPPATPPVAPSSTTPATTQAH